MQIWADGATGAHRGGRTAQSLLDLCRVHVELGEGTAKCVAMHAELFCSLALVAAMAREYFEDETLFELAHSVRVRKTGGVHLKNEVVEIAFHSRSSL